MAGLVLEGLLALLDRQEARLGAEQLLGLLSLYALVNIVDYLQRGAGAARAQDPALQKALAAVLGNAEGDAGQALAALAKSLGKNPATLMSLVNMLAADKKDTKAQPKS